MVKRGTTRREFLKATGGVGLLALAPSLITGCGGSDRRSYRATISEMTAAIDKQMTDSGVKGLAIALVDDQRIVWTQGFGYADAASNIPATADTHFEIGSNSKTFAGVMIAQLVERGLLALDDPLSKYLQGFTIGSPLGFPAGGPVTIRSMLTHHSGIPGDVMNGAFTFGVSRPAMNQRLLTYLAGDNLAYPRDFIYDYSNTASALLADVIASASGVSFSSYAESLFQMLGMDDTSFDSNSPKVAGSRAKGYKNGQEAGPFFCNLGTAGSIISTVNDMGKYLKMIMASGQGERGRVLRDASVEMMLAPQPSQPLDGDELKGYLWGLRAFGFDYAGKTCSHDGGTITMSSYMVVLRDHKLAAVALANTAEAGGGVGNVVTQTLQLALAEKTGIAAPGPYSPTYSPPAKWAQSTLENMTGTYLKSGAAGGYIKIAAVSGGLEWNEAGQKTSIIPRENGWLSAADSQAAQYQFATVSGRNVIMWRLMHPTFGEKTAVFAERYAPIAIPDTWKGRIGTWEAIDLDPADFQLHIAGGGNPRIVLSITDEMLILDSTALASGGSFIVQAVDNTRGYIGGLGRREGSAVRVLNVGGLEELQFLGVRYSKH